MIKARVVRLRYHWLVGIFFVYAKLVDAKLHIKRLSDVTESREFLRYCDIRFPIYDKDRFADRIVAINIENGVFRGQTYENQLITTGVYINENHVLTSYTPFRRLASDMKYRDLTGIYVTHITAKWKDKRLILGYVLETVDVICGRQIFPNSSTDFEQGDNFLHFPNFDLMVFKTAGYRRFLTQNTSFTYPEPNGNGEFFVMGPQLTLLANATTFVGDTLKFISLGMIDYDHVYLRNHLHTVTLDTNDRLLTDCEEWFDEANTFICIRNLEQHVSIGSGSFLFTEDVVIGVGCFTLIKGKESIHVFTDVRNVLQLINVTCTEFDGYPDPTIPPPTPSTSTSIPVPKVRPG